MTLLQAFILGVVQGLTEFLPISSSGHLVIGQHLFGLQQADLAFDVSVHVGTLVAVVIFFRHDIRALLMALVRWRPSAPHRSVTTDGSDIDARLAMLIFLGSIPTALIGLAIKRYEATLFGSPLIAGVMLMERAARRYGPTRHASRVGWHASTYRLLVLAAVVTGVMLSP